MLRLILLLCILVFIPPCESRAQCTEDNPYPELARLGPWIGGGVPAGGGGADWYYPSGLTIDDFNDTHDGASSDYHTGALITVVAGGTITKAGAYGVAGGEATVLKICIFNSDGTELKGSGTVTPGTTDKGWYDAVDLNIAVNTNDILFVVESPSDVFDHYCSSSGTGYYTGDDYPNCTTSVTMDANSGYLYGMRIYVEH